MAIAAHEVCASPHVIYADGGAAIFYWSFCVSGSDSSWTSLGHTCSDWGVALLSEIAASLRQPALGQDNWSNGLVCLVAAFYVLTLRCDQR